MRRDFTSKKVTPALLPSSNCLHNTQTTPWLQHLKPAWQQQTHAHYKDTLHDLANTHTMRQEWDRT